METLPGYWKWDDAVSPEMCDILLKERGVLEETQARVAEDAAYKVNTTARNSKVCWAKQNHWVESILYNHALYANELAGWAYHIGRPEQVQLTAYGENNFYGWHEDWAPLAITPTVRKLSVVLLLADPNEFEGGQFQFDEDTSIDMKRGTLLVFPSFLRHQVTPVTKGMRYSAVCWVHGPRTF
jgi:PKHD-type hydroxylase